MVAGGSCRLLFILIYNWDFHEIAIMVEKYSGAPSESQTYEYARKLL
jgi:hypothetical protein